MRVSAEPEAKTANDHDAPGYRTSGTAAIQLRPKFRIPRSISSLLSPRLKALLKDTFHRLANHTLDIRHSNHTTSNRQTC